MNKHPELMHDLAQSAHHPFRPRTGRRDRTREHRYERRRLRQYVRQAGWFPAAAGEPTGGLPEIA